MRKAFNFYRSYAEVYFELSDKDKIQFIDALLNKQFSNIDPQNLTGMAKFAYLSQEHSIKSQVDGFIAKMGDFKESEGGSVGGSQGGIEGGLVQVEGKEEDKGKGKPGIEERKAEFYKLLTPHVEKYGKDLLREFYNYWTEHGPKDRKMKFEKQKSFDPELRLSNWKKREIKFESNGKAKVTWA